MDDEITNDPTPDQAAPAQETVMPMPTPTPTPAAPSEFPLTLDEFCTQQSKHDKRVEALGGFHYVEKVAGRLKDTRQNYLARFEAFMNQPA